MNNEQDPEPSFKTVQSRITCGRWEHADKLGYTPPKDSEHCLSHFQLMTAIYGMTAYSPYREVRALQLSTLDNMQRGTNFS